MTDAEFQVLLQEQEGWKDDQGKPRMELLPFGALLDVAKVLTFGAGKYGPDDWKAVENGEARYTGALLRHLAAWREGEDLDPESGLRHLAHMTSCALILLARAGSAEQ